MAVASNGTLYIVGGRDRSTGSVHDAVLFTPLLDFEKLATPSGPVNYGDTISYTLRLTNLGVRDLETLDITDTVQTNVPTVVEFHNLPVECQVCPHAADTITCTVPSLGLTDTEALGFQVTISQSIPALLSAPTSPQVPSVASTSHITWTHVCSAAHLEVLGVGISGTLTSALPIPSPETIIGDSIRVQAAFKIDPGDEPGEVTFFSGDHRYPLTEPTSSYSFTAVYEQDVQVSDVISVEVGSADDRKKARALTAYFLRNTEEGHSLAGHTMNQSLYGKTYTQTYTRVLKLPPHVHNGDITLKAVVTDNNDPERGIRLIVQAGGEVTFTAFTEPNHGDCLDIRELQLSGIPTATNEVTVVAQSPPSNGRSGESFGLVGLVVETECRSTPTPTPTPIPLRVWNRAQACERGSTGCWYTSYMNTDLHVYLPLVLKNAP
jgi:hypothetical protein